MHAVATVTNTSLYDTEKILKLRYKNNGHHRKH